MQDKNSLEPSVAKGNEADSGSGHKGVLARVLPWARAICTVAVAFVLGVLFNLIEAISQSQEWLVIGISIGLGAATLLLVTLAVLQRRAKHKLHASTRDSLKHARHLAEALAVGRSEGKPPPDLGGLVRNTFEAAPQLITTWLVGRAYWRLFLGIGSVVGAAVLVAQFTMLAEQTKRLTEQNDLIELEGQLAIRADHADLEAEQARRAYDEITQILDESTSPAAIVYALERLPEAMLMPVTIVDADADADPSNPQLITRTVYPNLVSLAERLLIFARTSRLEAGMTWSEEETTMVSTSICMALHRLGHDNTEDIAYGECVWDCIYRENDGARVTNPGAALEKLLAKGKGLTSILTVAGIVEGEDQPNIDLRHIRPLQLFGADLRGALLQDARLDGLFLMRVKLQDATLDNAQLQQADLTQAQLQGATFNNAYLLETILTEAQLQGADLNIAQLQRAVLNEANLQGASLLGAQLQESYLEEAQLQLADFTEANLQGARLRGAQLQGASLMDAHLQRAGLFGTQLQGAYLRNAQLQRAYLKDAQLQGADLGGAQLQIANLGSAGLQGANLMRCDLTGANLDQAKLNAEAITFILTAENGRAWLKATASREADQESITLDLPAAAMFGARILPFTLDWKSLNPVELNLAHHHKFKDPDFFDLSWLTRDQAKSQLREPFMDNELSAEKPELLVSRIIQVRTTFRGADLTGATIDKETLDLIAPEACRPSPEVVFANAAVSATRPPLDAPNNEYSWPSPIPGSYILLEWVRDPSKRPHAASSGEDSSRPNTSEVTGTPEIDEVSQ